MTTSVSGGMAKLLWIMICFLPLYSVGRASWLGQRTSARPMVIDNTDKGVKEKRIRWAREIVLALFVLFMSGLLMLTFENPGFSWTEWNFLQHARERVATGWGINFAPFRTIRGYIKYSSDRGCIMVNIVGNIVMFLPWGMGLPLLWRKNWSPFRLASRLLMLPVCIEFIQLFIGRSVDIDDVILNFTGGVLGGLSYLVLVRAFPGLKGLAE